jgi:hypothetical protein
MAGGEWMIRGVDLPGDWCDLSVFAPNRADFIRKVEALGVPLPRGWKKTRPEPTVTHTCGADDLPHVAPLMALIVVVGTIKDVLEVVELAAVEPRRGTYAWRLDEALAVQRAVRVCEMIR